MTPLLTSGGAAVARWLHAGQPEAVAESEAGRLSRELAPPVELAIQWFRSLEGFLPPIYPSNLLPIWV